MYTFLGVLLISEVAALGNILLKSFNRRNPETTVNIIWYNVINALASLINLGIVGFGRLALNRVTFVYSAVLCISVAANLVLNICVMSRLSLAAVGVLAGTGSVAGTVLFGVLFLNEKITCNFFLSIIFVLIAVLIPFVTLRPKTEKTLKASDIIISMLFFISGGTGVIINKLYVSNPDNGGSVALFFWLNVFLMAFSLAALMVYSLKNKPSFKSLIHIFGVRDIVNICVRTISSNYSAFIVMAVLKKMDISLYGILTSSLALVSTGAVSKFYFKDHIPKKEVISMLLAVIAIILAYI